MAAAGRGDEVAVEAGDDRLTAAELLAGAWAGAELAAGADALAYVGTNGLAFPVGLFAAAAAGVPFVPLNYRLGDEQLHDMLAPLGDVLVVAEARPPTRCVGPGPPGRRRRRLRGRGPGRRRRRRRARRRRGHRRAALHERHHRGAEGGGAAPPPPASYVIGTVEFGGAGADEAVLVSVPPYHVAGLANLLSNLYLGPPHRLPRASSTPPPGCATVRDEGITHAMVVPTMLARICDVLERRRRRAARRCGRCPTAAPARRPRCSSGSWRCSPTSTSPTPTASPRPARRSPCSAPTTTGPPRAGDPSPPPGWRRPAGCCRPSRSRSAATTAAPCPPARPARSGSGASRCRASTAGVGAAARRRRLVPHPRPRLGRRRRLPVHRGPQRRHDHPRRREHRAGRDRGGAAARTPTSPSAPWSASPTTSGASASPRSWCPRPGATVDADELRAFARAGAAGLEDARRGRLRRRAALHRDGQAAAPGRAERPAHPALAAATAGRTSRSISSKDASATSGGRPPTSGCMSSVPCSTTSLAHSSGVTMWYCPVALSSSRSATGV